MSDMRKPIVSKSRFFIGSLILIYLILFVIIIIS